MPIRLGRPPDDTLTFPALCDHPCRSPWSLGALVLAGLLITGCGGGGGSSAAPVTPTVSASTLPLLDVNKLVGVVYSAPAPAAQTTLNADFTSCIAAGANTYELAVTWASLESAPGTVDVSGLTSLLATVKSSGLVPYLVIKTIDTNQLALPPDLMSTTITSQFAGTLGFDSTIVLQRFGAVLDQVTPLLVQYGGFYLSVGNEVDVWLTGNPSQQSPFATFLNQARTRVHQSNDRLAVGVTCTSGIVTAAPTLLSSLLGTSDAVSYTYYPLNSDYTVRDPSVVSGDLAQLVSASAGLVVLLQEVGYPSGYIPTPGNGSSVTKQQQFVQNIFTALSAQTSIRFCSFMQMADYTPAEVATYETYYGISDPEFVEYLSTLGLVDSTGVSKAAFQALLTGLGTVMSMPSAPG